MVKLEYHYTNNAWGYTKFKYIFDLINKKILYENNEKNLTNIATIEPHEINEMGNQLSKITLDSNSLALVRTGNAFDAGDGSYYLVLSNGKKVLLGTGGNTQSQSSNPNIVKLVKIIDKYVRLANKFVNHI